MNEKVNKSILFIDTPKTCSSCPFNYDDTLCLITDTCYVLEENFNFMNDRLPDCPLQDVKIDVEIITATA